MLEAPAVESRGVEKTYKKVGFFGRSFFKALKNIDFRVKERESYGIVGESGSGKSTLCRIVTGLDRDFKGEVFLFGRDIKSLGRELPRTIQIIFQNPFASLNPLMRVRSIILEGLRINGLRNEDWVLKLFEKVGFTEKDLERYPHQFSGGERQRIAIVRALSLRPRILVADEPLSALDVSIQAEIMELLRELKRELGLTLLFVSHDLRVVREMCDRVLVMLDGYVVEEGPAREVFEKPMHPYTAFLAESIPPDHPRDRKERKELPEREEGACPFFRRCPRAKVICKTTLPNVSELKDRRVFCHDPRPC